MLGDFPPRGHPVPRGVHIVKICDVTQFYSPRSGGVKRYITEKRRYVETCTQDEHYLVIPGETTAYRRNGRLHQFTVQSPRVDRTSRYRILLNTRAVRDFLDDIRPDVIESGDPYHLAWTALNAGRELHIPVLGFYHSHFPDAYLRTILKYGGHWLRDVVMSYAQDYITRLYSRFHRTLVPSDHLRALLHNWGVHNAVTMHLGVDTTAFCPGPPDPDLRRELGVPEDAFLLLYVGRLSGEKNIATLLAAFEKLTPSRRWWLAVVGDGPLRRLLPAVREKTRALSWRAYVDSNAELARYYRAANLFVHPGVCETFGLVVLECQACGCPAAGIRGSYMDANIFAGLEDWARENTPKALATAIERLAQRDLPRLGADAGAIVRERYSWPAVLPQLWSHYRDAHEHDAHPLFYGETYPGAPA